MTAVDGLWFLADNARQQAAQTYHRLTECHDEYLERRHESHLSRRRFRQLAGRIERTGGPYGAHTLVYRPSGDLLLCRHEGVDRWVLPGGGVDGRESFRECAERELAEEAGVRVAFEGLGILTRVEIRTGEHRTWGVMPVFAARALTEEPRIDDPDGEISEARWFTELPADLRDREDVLAWRETTL